MPMELTLSSFFPAVGHFGLSGAWLKTFGTSVAAFRLAGFFSCRSVVGLAFVYLPRFTYDLIVETLPKVNSSLTAKRYARSSTRDGG
jgi:hypothetical protein